MANHEKTWLRHVEQQEAKGDEKTRAWSANGEPTPAFYVNHKSSYDTAAGDMRGRYGQATLTGEPKKNRNLNADQFN